MNNEEGPSDAMQVNIVKVLEDRDFRYSKNLCDENEGWNLVYEKKATQVWTKRSPQTDSNLHMIKARSVFKDVSPEVAYDVLHDIDYRSSWDKYMIGTEPIGYLNPTNDIYYYSLGSLPPFRSRDFVMQRSWLDTGSEKYLLAHSVWHDKFPPTKAHIRGIIHTTIYFVRRLDGGGCQITYLTNSDPKGKLPSWFVNRLTKIIAPKLIKKMHKACLHYTEWKKTHKSEQKPWLCLDVPADYPKINLEECRPKLDVDDLASIDESGAVEITNNEANDEEED